MFREYAAAGALEGLRSEATEAGVPSWRAFAEAVARACAV
jgi:hypothetical protein